MRSLAQLYLLGVYAYVACPLGEALALHRRQVLTGVAGIGTAAAGAAVALAKNDGSKIDELFTPGPGTLAGQTIVITGGTTGLGLESVKRLALGGANIILTARSRSKGEASLLKVQEFLSQRGSQNPNISYKVVDLDILDMVRDVPKTWEDISTIDVLLNNAGVMAIPERQLTVDGYERTMQSNHLGHFALTALLAPKLSPKARIVNVSSEAYKFAAGTGLLSSDSLWKPGQSEYGPWKAYGQSKLANILFTQELQRRCEMAGKEWTAVSLHPGAVNTDLGRYLVGEEKFANLQDGKGSFTDVVFAKALSAFVKDVPHGATTQVYLAAQEDLRTEQDVRGQYVIDCKVSPLQRFAKDSKAAERLWKESEDRVALSFVI